MSTTNLLSQNTSAMSGNYRSAISRELQTMTIYVHYSDIKQNIHLLSLSMVRLYNPKPKTSE